MKRYRINIIRKLRDSSYDSMIKYEKVGDNIMRNYCKGRYEAQEQILDITEVDYEEKQGFWQGSLKVASVLGFLYIVGYLLSKGLGA